MLENNGWQSAGGSLRYPQLSGDRDRFGALVTGQELLIRQSERFNGANLRSRRQILQTRFRYRRLSPHETQNHRSYPNYECHRSLLVVCRKKSSLIFNWPYFLTNFFKSLAVVSAPYTLPMASAATPSGTDSLSGSGPAPGIRAWTDPSLALPILMPRLNPGLRFASDWESVT